MLRVALLAEEAAGARVLEAVAARGHRVAALLTSPGSPVWALGARLGCAPQPAARVREPAFAAELERAEIDLLLNVHSLHLVPEAALRAPRLGAYNLHPGPLPQYAGLNAPSWAIYNGEESHGVTVHRMEAGIDTGPIVYRESFAIGPRDTGLSLALRCAQRGVSLVLRLLDAAASDPASLPLLRQDLSRRRYYGRGAPQEGRVDWRQPARRIRDFVRAADYRPFASPWGAPRARLGDEEVELLEVALTYEPARAPAGALRREGGATLVAAADEWLRVACARPCAP